MPNFPVLTPRTWLCPGIEPTGNSVGAPARFTVETFSAGRGEIEVTILNPKGGKEPVSILCYQLQSCSLFQRDKIGYIS